MENNLLILGCYGFKDGYYAYGRYFSKYFDNVSFFPLFELRDRLNENNEKYSIEDIKCIIENKKIDKYLYSDNLIIRECNHNNILLCHNNDFLKTFKMKDINFFDLLIKWKSELEFNLLQINWDPDINNMKWDGLKHIDISYSSNPFYLRKKNITIFNQGFCKETSKYEELEEFKCDVSFLGTNLYDGWPENKVNRRKVLDKIYQDKDISLHVYGPEFLKDLYPDSYKGFIRYDDCYKVFSNSKINLNISPLVDVEYNGEYYYSERLPQIIGCSSIMMCNNDFGDMLIKNKDYIYLDKIDSLIELIHKYKEGVLREKMLKRIEKNKKLFDYEYIIPSLFDNSILKFLDKIYYINLNFRKDRNEKILNEIKKIDPLLKKTERFNAVHHDKGFIGCAESHLKVLEECIKNDFNNVLVLEDDFKFRNLDFKTKIRDLFNYDKEFNIFLLGRNLIESEKTNKEGIVEVLNSHTTSGYIINKRIYNSLHQIWKDGLEKLKQDPINNRNNYSCDVSWKKLQGRGKKIYTTFESIGYQITDFSDIEQRFVNYIC